MAIPADNGLEVESHRLKLLTLIGEGSSAKVYQGLLREVRSEDAPESVRLVAVKHFDWSNSMLGLTEQRDFNREVELLRNLQHPNIISLLGVQSTMKPLRIVLELCTGGDLFLLLHMSKTVQLSWNQQRRMCADIANAMSYLHSRNPVVMHRDLKSMNVLLQFPVTGPGDVPVLKLADFGLSRTKPTGTTGDEEAAAPEECRTRQARSAHLSSAVGSWQWMAPEVMLGIPYDEKVDVFSFGILMHEIMSGIAPYEDQEDISAIQMMVLQGVRPDMALLPTGCHQDLKALMKMCWALNPRKRPSFQDALQVLQSLV